MVKIGFIGVGMRGTDVLQTILQNEEVEIVGICDEYLDKAQNAADIVKTARGKEPFITKDYKEILAIKEIEAVIIVTAWEAHVPIAIDAMKAKKYVGVEVGGAYSLADCFRLVETSETTGMPCMMLENCCYDRRETMILNMVRQGFFGEIVHCDGGYQHCIQGEVTRGKENRHYRLRNYVLRNCDNYPTHELGPICKMLNINRGNRLVSLTSTASKAAGIRAYAEEYEGADHISSKLHYNQGDVVTTVIKCANGETITLSLDTALPRFYSRCLQVRGTLAIYDEDTDSIFSRKHTPFEKPWKPQWGNAEKFEEEYLHPLWKEYLNQQQKPGYEGMHGGMDWLVYNAFFDAVKNKTQTPIDVYETALWMSISPLTEESIALGSAPVAIPDFTHGMWLRKRPVVNSKYCLDAESDREFD